MEKKRLGIIVVVIVVILVVVIVNFNLKKDSEELEGFEQLEGTLGKQETAETNEIESENVSTEIVPYKEVYPSEAKDLIEVNFELIIIDASSKYNLGHIPNAVNYRYNNGNLEDALGSLDKQAKYLVYSSSDPEGKNAAQLMVDAGFQDVYMLKGSYGLWIQEGYDYERSFISGFFIWENWF